MIPIPFHRPLVTGDECRQIEASIRGGKLAGEGPSVARCERSIERLSGCGRAMLVPSGTAALEHAALVAGIRPGDEVIMPSLTFVSTANAFVLRGAVPVFVDVEADTLDVDPARVQAAVTDRTRAIVPVHYAGVVCDMKAICGIAERHRLAVIEDAAQAVGASRAGRGAGSIGTLGCFSFHETKNIHCGEGGALTVNDPTLVAGAEVARQKGTDRGRFLRGEVDRYTWRARGSSFLLGEVPAAFLEAQLAHEARVTAERRRTWETYRSALAPFHAAGRIRIAQVPGDAVTNGHIFWVLAESGPDRERLMHKLVSKGVETRTHYVPLHDSEAGRRFGRVVGPMDRTLEAGERLFRLPMWNGVDAARVADATFWAMR